MLAYKQFVALAGWASLSWGTNKPHFLDINVTV